MRLSDSIESFIKELLNDEQPEVELKRNELAAYFNCAPSQINYVLTTRFSPARGYVTESRRGGGGCIRIVRVVQDKSSLLLYLINEGIGERLTENEAGQLILRLEEERQITAEEAGIMRAALSSQTLGLPIP